MIIRKMCIFATFCRVESEAAILRFDLRQGELGNCWMVTTVAGLAMHKVAARGNIALFFSLGSSCTPGLFSVTQLRPTIIQAEAETQSGPLFGSP